MEKLRQWILAITALSMLIAVCQSIMPPGAVKRASRLSCGLLLFLALVRPILTADYTELVNTLSGEVPAPSEETEELLAASEALTVSLIEEQSAAYIQDKAEEAGISCVVSVTCGDGQEVAAPEAMTVTGALDAQERERLLSWAEELDLGADSVTFQEEGGN